MSTSRASGMEHALSRVAGVEPTLGMSRNAQALKRPSEVNDQRAIPRGSIERHTCITTGPPQGQGSLYDRE